MKTGVVAVITLVVLVPIAALATFMVMVISNGVMSASLDAMTNIYLACMCGSMLALSLLSGFIAQAVNKASSIPIWATGAATIFAAAVLEFIILIAACFVILAAFGIV